MPREDAVRELFSDWYAENVLVPFFRGFACLLAMDSRLRRVAGVTDPRESGPMDEMVVEIGRRLRRGEDLAKDLGG